MTIAGRNHPALSKESLPLGFDIGKSLPGLIASTFGILAITMRYLYRDECYDETKSQL